MSEVQTSVIKDIMKEKELTRIKREIENDMMTKQQGHPAYQQPVINITINPVINTTSQNVEKTKNSPLHELGSVLSFIPNIFGK